MYIFRLSRNSLEFPPVELALEEGLLAMGGDLSPQRLLEAYRRGIFPWYSSEEPILWWSPDPRFVLYPSQVHVSRSMKRVFKQHQFTFTFDTVFREVIGNCQASPRPGQSGTWITEEMKEAYIKLHEMGYAHSVESWQNGKLAGGLYGVSLGGAFFGESMFSRVNNASKAALIHLCRKLEEKGFHFLDAQVYTPHMEKLGAEYIPRSEFQDLLEKAMKSPTVKGSWKDWV